MSEDDLVAKKADARISVKDYLKDEPLKADVSYSLVNLSDAMQRQAALYVHYGQLLSKCSRQVQSLELLLEVNELTAYRKRREEFVASGVKPTEAMLDKSVAVSNNVMAVKKALIEAKQIESNAKTAVKALEQRRDMLIQSGATERHEMNGQVRLKASDAVLENQKSRVLERIRGDA